MRLTSAEALGGTPLFAIQVYVPASDLSTDMIVRTLVVTKRSSLSSIVLAVSFSFTLSPANHQFTATGGIPDAVQVRLASVLSLNRFCGSVSSNIISGAATKDKKWCLLTKMSYTYQYRAFTSDFHSERS